MAKTVRQAEPIAALLKEGRKFPPPKRFVQRARIASAAIYKEAKRRADSLWKDPQRRLSVCGGKDLLRLLNGRLQSAGHDPVGTQALSGSLRPSEIPDEVKSILERIEEDAR